MLDAAIYCYHACLYGSKGLVIFGWPYQSPVGERRVIVGLERWVGSSAAVTQD